MPYVKQGQSETSVRLRAATAATSAIHESAYLIAMVSEWYWTAVQTAMTQARPGFVLRGTKPAQKACRGIHLGKGVCSQDCVPVPALVSGALGADGRPRNVGGETMWESNVLVHGMLQRILMFLYRRNERNMTECLANRADLVPISTYSGALQDAPRALQRAIHSVWRALMLFCFSDDMAAATKHSGPDKYGNGPCERDRFLQSLLRQGPTTKREGAIVTTVSAMRSKLRLLMKIAKGFVSVVLNSIGCRVACFVKFLCVCPPELSTTPNAIARMLNQACQRILGCRATSPSR